MRLSKPALVLGFMLSPLSATASTLTYWNIFNIEGESAVTADIVTYGTLADMLADTNRLGVFQPQGNLAGRNVVGSGSDGTTYWNVFNIEGESAVTADIVTYGTFLDMLADTNRLGVFQPQGNLAGRNVVDSGSDGTTYWNVFNIEGESAVTADIVIYGTLTDMLVDTNRLGVFQPQGNLAGRNAVGAGASVRRPGVEPVPAVIPLPAAGWFYLSGLLLLSGLRPSHRSAPATVRGSRGRVGGSLF